MVNEVYTLPFEIYMQMQILILHVFHLTEKLTFIIIMRNVNENINNACINVMTYTVSFVVNNTIHLISD